jgi:hypothetical protein
MLLSHSLSMLYSSSVSVDRISNSRCFFSFQAPDKTNSFTPFVMLIRCRSPLAVQFLSYTFHSL